MCDLSQGVFELAYKEGFVIGYKEGFEIGYRDGAIGLMSIFSTS
jgi:hypothetical protein